MYTILDKNDGITAKYIHLEISLSTITFESEVTITFGIGFKTGLSDFPLFIFSIISSRALV